MLRARELCVVVCVSASAASCAPPTDRQAFVPEAVIDLGALVTPDLPEQVWGRAFLDAMGFDKPNELEVISWSFEADGDRVSGQNSYFTLFNHGGPHVDAPNHIGFSSGVDAYPIDAFTGPLKVFDVRRTEPGWTVGREHFEGLVHAGDVVLIYTAYQAPTGDDFPAVVALSREAAEYLAQIPVRAFGTDSFSADSPQGVGPIDAPTAVGRLAPVHDSFLSRGIPVYEQLRNLDRLLGQQRLYFVGAPLNMAAGDGMMVRPVALVY